MENRITRLFDQKKNGILNIYCTAGYPGPNDTLPVLRALQEAGVDMVELGMPYSDPLADGPTIQESSRKALQNGMNLNKLFQELEGLREEICLPVVLMGYYNTVMRYGAEKFIQKAAEVGVDGVILPDLPLEEYRELYKQSFEANNLSMIFLVTPTTEEERIREIDENTTGFIYMVSGSATTGTSVNLDKQENYFKKITGKVRNPTLIGFGIKDRESFEKACQSSHGAIIGSAFIRALEGGNNVSQAVKTFVGSIRTPQKSTPS